MSHVNGRLRIAVADDEPDMCQFFREILSRLGHQVIAATNSGRDLVDQCRANRPDLVITDIKMPDMDGVEAAAALNREKPVPVILVTAYPGSDFPGRAGESHIMAYLVKPIKPPDLQAAIALAVIRFEEFQELKQEAADLRQALEDRKTVERAKGIIMRRLRLEEPQAFRRLQKMASDENRRLVEIARTVLSSDDVFQSLERL
jgi:response regulator NasT